MNEPFLVEDREQIEAMPPFPFPAIEGDDLPDEWEPTGTVLFCDSSGFGLPGEPALTPEQLRAELRVGYGYAITDMGQFQLYVSEFQVRQGG